MYNEGWNWGVLKVSKNTEVWKKASEVYSEISELSPQQALAHVYGIENITLDVRNAVITLINAGSQASQFYRDKISQNFNLGINSSQSFLVGQQLDEYELLEEIGHGGMSQVFKAQRINAQTQTHVAIKVFAPKDNSNELLNHFLNEQKILAGLSHPNIVKMLHSGKTDDNTTYLVMELIADAQPLDEYCKDNKLTIKQKIKYITQCAQALSYSHANLIIHRDLKPDNILINNDKELKIVDFGIAKLINNDLSGNKTTIMALTPSYAAPEQINSGSISIKTDIFSLAVVALDLLTKEDPLPKDRLVKSCSNDEQHIDVLLKKLKIDKDLKNILHKALAQEPAKRYSSMQSFADDLNNYLANKPVNATAQSFFYRVQKFAKRRSALFATMLSFLVFMVIGSIVGYMQYQQIKVEAQKAQVVKQFMLDAFEVTDPDKNKGQKITADILLKIASNKLKKNTQLDQEIKFELLQTIGVAYGKLGFYETALENLMLSKEIKNTDSKTNALIAEYLLKSNKIQELNSFLETNKENLTSNDTDMARIVRIKASLLMKNSKFEEAKNYLQKALDINLKADNAIETILTQKQWAQLLYLQSKPKKAIKLLETILKEKVLQNNSILTLTIKNNLATYYNKIGKFNLAQKVYENIIHNQRELLGSAHPDLGESLIELADVYRSKGELKKSLKVAQESYDIFVKLNGENSIRTATALNMLGILSFMSNDMDSSIKQLRKVVQILETEYSPDHLETLEAKANLAGLLNALHRTKEAEVLLREVYQSQLKKLGAKHLSTLFTQQHLANALSALGQHQEAIDLAEKIVKTSSQTYGENNPTTLGAYLVLGRNYANGKQYEKSLKIFLHIQNKKLIETNNPKYPTILLAIAEDYNQLDQGEKANNYYLKSIESHKGIYSESNLVTINSQLKYAHFLQNNNRKKELVKILDSIKSTIKNKNIKSPAILKDLKVLSRY